MKMLRPFLAIGLLLSVAACQTHSGPAVFSNDKHVGKYKVGEPYQIDGKWYTPQADENYEEEGMASWYGPGFHKKLTANGDEFDQNALTAAHRTLPMPSMVRVTNLDNGRSLVVMVNDRGPFSKGRILDLSSRAAEILGFRDKGLAKVRVKFLPGQTRRLLAQLDVPPHQHKTNPFATADANFGHSEDQEHAALASEGEVSSFMDGLGLPLPDVFSVKNADAIASQTPVADSDAPIGLEPEGSFNEGFKAFMKPAEEPKPVQQASAQVAPLPETLPQSSEIVIKEPAPLQPKMTAEVEEIEDNNEAFVMAEPSDQGGEVEASYAVPEGKVLLDESDPRFVEQVYFIQAGSFRIAENALRVKESLSILGEKTEVETIELAEGDISRVRLGPIYNEDRAKQTLQRVINMGHADAMIVGN